MTGTGQAPRGGTSRLQQQMCPKGNSQAELVRKAKDSGAAE